MSTWEPGDVANDHVLGKDGTWRPLSQPGVVAVVNTPDSALAPATALIAGVLGLAVCWIPILGIVGWIFGPIAVLFALFGIQRGKAEHKVMSWIGGGCGVVTLLVCFIYFMMIVDAFSTSS